MLPLSLFQSIEATTLGTIVRQSLWLFPVIECLHLLAMALLGGTILAVDMRLLGFGLTGQPAAELERKLSPWMTGSLITAIVSGILMFLSEAVKCYYSPPFWYKIGCLVIATLYAFTIRRRIIRGSSAQLATMAAAVVSLALWFGVAFSGRWIAFY